MLLGTALLLFSWSALARTNVTVCIEVAEKSWAKAPVSLRNGTASQG